ncbi:hypothetical protein PM082_024741 [Marasmius tenuissimus]|nr:hypothetical protein PM082_024741 [Marasmius tenuissimus]
MKCGFGEAAAGALWTYDVLINIDLELAHIWVSLNSRKRPFKLTKAIFNVLYLAQRYMPLLDSVFLDQYFIMGPKDTRGCVITYTLSAWSSILGIELSELLLAPRIWAVWARGTTIGIILVVISLGCVVPAMVFFGRFVGGVQYPLLEIPTPRNEDLRRCFYTMQNKDIYLCWIVLMIYDGGALSVVLP